MAFWIIFWELFKAFGTILWFLECRKELQEMKREGVTWNDRLSMKSTQGRSDQTRTAQFEP